MLGRGGGVTGGDRPSGNVRAGLLRDPDLEGHAPEMHVHMYYNVLQASMDLPGRPQLGSCIWQSNLRRPGGDGGAVVQCVSWRTDWKAPHGSRHCSLGWRVLALIIAAHKHGEGEREECMVLSLATGHRKEEALLHELEGMA